MIHVLPGAGRPRVVRTVVMAAAVSLAAAAALTAPDARADVVSLAPSKDNTLYQDPGGALSNGAGEHIFAGHTSVFTNVVRRAVIAFDIAGSVPAGSTIDAVTLQLHVSQAPFAPALVPFALHRLLADWGEGTSNALGQEGGGTSSTTGDATWIHRFFNSLLWTTVGGDFSPTASATQNVADIGFYAWGPAAQMRADVQAWLDTPSSNFGWLIRGDETRIETARRFDSRQNLTPSFRPVLTLQFTRPAAGAGRVPDGASAPGAPLTVEGAAGGQIRLSWGPSCLPADSDFEIYEGSLTTIYSHTMRLCLTGGAATATFLPAPGSTYYLIVPRGGGREGSYGVDSAGNERPQGVPACLPREIAACP